MDDRVKVRFVRYIRLAEGVARPGDTVMVDASTARFLFAVGAAEIVAGDAGVPKDAKMPERGLLTR